MKIAGTLTIHSAPARVTYSEMLLFLVILVVVVVGPALAYVEWQRWRGNVTIEPPFDAMNHDPPRPLAEGPKRLPNITDIGVG